MRYIILLLIYIHTETQGEIHYFVTHTYIWISEVLLQRFRSFVSYEKLTNRLFICLDPQRYGSGLDIILPSGWAMPFWIALVYQGACVGGANADENISLEALSTHFPTRYPDSHARQSHVVLLHEEKLQKHRRYTKIIYVLPI